MRVVVALLLFGLALSGCTDVPDPAPATDPDPCLVESPTDYSCDELMTPGVDNTTAHLHDYWGGGDTLTVVDTVLPTGGIWMGGPMAWAVARPDPEDVVPQGTASVDITVSWQEPSATQIFTDPQLWVRTAAQNEPEHVADLQNGDTVTIETVTADADLPHQVLSAWVFQWVISPDGEAPMTYDGDVTFTVVAHRGLEIPLYPGHPDRWGGASEFHLFDAGQMQIYQGSSYDGNWGCFQGCPEVHRPDDGVIVPFDADRVEVTLTQTYDTPFVLGLAYHGATSRDWSFPDPAQDGATRTYVIPVEDMGDGPYAQQSLWEFIPYIEGPNQDGFTVQEYTLSATVYRDPA